MSPELSNIGIYHGPAQSPGHILILTLRKVRETKRIRFGKIGICKMGVYTSAVTHGDIVWDVKDPAHNLTAFLYTVTFKEIEYSPLEPKKPLREYDVRRETKCAHLF